MTGPAKAAGDAARAWWMSPASHGAVDTPEAHAARLIWQDVADLHDAFREHYKDDSSPFAEGVKHVLRDLAGLLYPNNGFDG